MKQYASFLLFLLAFLCLPGINHVHAQQRQIDSLHRALSNYEALKSKSGAVTPTLRDTVKVHILTALFQAYYTQNDNKNALKYAFEELALSKQIGYQWGIGTSYNFIGAAYEQKSNYTAAIDYYKKSLLAKKGGKDKIGIIDTYQNIGVTYSKLGRYPEALKYVLDAINLSKSINDDFGIMGGYNNLGIIYNAQGNYAEALKSYMICAEISNKLKDVSTASVIYLNIGEIYILQNNHKKALQYLTKGLKLAQDSGNRESEAHAYNAIGTIRQQEKKYSEALAYFQKALDIREAIEFAYGTTSSYLSMGNIYLEMGDHDHAGKFLKKGLAAAEKTGELELMREAHMNLSTLYKSKGNYRKAYDHQLSYASLKDSIFTIEKDRKITQMQMQHDFKVVRDSIQNLQDKKDTISREAQEREMRNRTTIFLILGIIVTFLIILLIQRNKIAKIKRETALAQERNRISRDLHDNLGAQLSTARMFISSLKNKHEDLDEKVDNTVLLLDDSILELRKIMNDTSNSVLFEKGYLAATEELINKIRNMHPIEFSLTHFNMEKRPDAKTEHEMFRITQELVNNTLKYADAKNVSIDALIRDGNFILMYEDDGKGFHVGQVPKGNGLNNIETRAANLQGSVEFDSAPGHGMRAVIEIPIKR